MALFTRLLEADFEALAMALGLGAPLAWEGIEAGTINSNYSVHTAGGRWFVRVNEGKSRADVDYENLLVDHLVARGVPTPSGRLHVDGSGRLITVFPHVDGEHRGGPALRPEDLAQVGRALAGLHVAAADFPERRASIYAFDRIIERRRAIAVEPDDALAAALAACDEEIDWLSAPERAAARAALPQAVIHGDLFPDNVLFDGDRLTALLDFEQASDGAPVYDLAVCLCAWCFVDQDFAAPLVAALARGYAEVRPLDPAEDALFYTMARTAALRFTVTRITDVELNPAATARRGSKSYRRFHARLATLRRLGEGGFRRLL